MRTPYNLTSHRVDGFAQLLAVEESPRAGSALIVGRGHVVGRGGDVDAWTCGSNKKVNSGGPITNQPNLT